MLETALAHFNEDICRANTLADHSHDMPTGILKDDLLRGSWMMSVGACDAYFSDAYADLASRAIRAKEVEPNVQIPNRLNNLKVPVTAVIREANGGWRWRMAARELIEDENVLSLNKIRQLFGHFFRKKHKLLNEDTIELWILDNESKKRMFGITPSHYRKLSVQEKGKARKAAISRMDERFALIFQRRHDCIHNCDRPKVALQNISLASTRKVSEDIDFLVSKCHEAMIAEFPIYLRDLGFCGTTRNRVGA